MAEYRILLERYANRHLSTVELVRLSLQDVRENDKVEMCLEPYITLLIRVGGQEAGSQGPSW